MSIVAIPSTESNCDNSGGIKYSYGVDKNEITAVTVDGTGVITGFTMSGLGLWAKVEFDDDENVAFYNQSGALNGSSIDFTQEAFMQFNGVTQAKIAAANQAKACCGTVWIHFFKDGSVVVQGIEVDNSQNWAFTKVNARVVPTANSGTGTENNLMNYSIQSTGRYLSSTTDLDEAAIEAL